MAKEKLKQEMHSIQSEPSRLANPKSASKQETETEKKNKMENNKETMEKPNNKKKKEVIITVYVESPSNPPLKKPTKSKPDQTDKTRGYDRRAQLLAYAKHLRNADPQHPPLPKNLPKPIQKSSKRSSDPVKIHRTKFGKRYQRLVPEVDVSCKPKLLVGKNKKAKKRSYPPLFVKKLRSMIKGFCRGD